MIDNSLIQDHRSFGRDLSTLTGAGTLACVAGTILISPVYALPALVGLATTHYINESVKKLDKKLSKSQDYASK